MRRFSQTGIQDFLTLTLREHSGLLYVGAREALFAFSVEALELQGVVRGGAAGGTQDWGCVAWAGCLTAQRSLLVSGLALALPFWVPPGGIGLGLVSEWGPGVTHDVAQAVFGAHTSHVPVTSLMCPFRSLDLLGGPG